jgi:hypothetical protein
MNEAAVQSHVRAALSYIGPNWRNNVGACEDKTGRLIRYGLGNDSAQLNDVIKSSDLISITPVPAFAFGRWTTLGVFTAIECKHSDWHMTPGDKRAVAQAAYHDIVRAAGGFAGFATSPADIQRIISK